MTLAPEEALKVFSKFEAVVEKHMGEGVFAFDHNYSRKPSGLFVIDHILGGGLVPGFILEVFGPESTGKTTFAAQVAAYLQQNRDARILYLDFEHTVSRKYFLDLGINVEKPFFFLSQPTTIEAGALLALHMMNLGLIDMLIWDTPAASQPAVIVNQPLSEKELREGMRDIESGKSGTGAIGTHARVFSHALAALVPAIAKSGTIAIFPNQIRTTIQSYGAGETTPGGRALKFYAAYRCRLSKKETVKEKVADDFFGTNVQTAVKNVVQFHFIKNKTADPFRLCEVSLGYGRGFLDKETTIDLAIKRKVIDLGRTGQFKLPDGHTGRGTQLIYDYYEDEAKYTSLKTALGETTFGDDEYAEAEVRIVTEDDDPEGMVIPPASTDRPDVAEADGVGDVAEQDDPLPTNEGKVGF